MAKLPYDDLPPRFRGGRPGDDDSETAHADDLPQIWSGPPMASTPETRARQKEAQDFKNIMDPETQSATAGTQDFWQTSLLKGSMPGAKSLSSQVISDTGQLPIPWAPAVDPMGRNVDQTAPMPGRTQGTYDKKMNQLPPAAPGVPGTGDNPVQPKFFFSPPPQDPHQILYTKNKDLTWDDFPLA